LRHYGYNVPKTVLLTSKQMSCSDNDH
jgi:hypothetical protein